MYLTIKHIRNSEKPFTFCLISGSDEGRPVVLTNPLRLTVDGFKDLSLRDGLRWYLEESPALQSHVDQLKADAVVKTLRRWGSESFNLLFDQKTYQWYRECHDDPEQLHIRIESESPRILSWPWEALCDTGSSDSGQEQSGLFLGTWCSIERHISSQNTQWLLPERPEYLRMLLVIARPFGDKDVGFHAVSRALVDYVQDERCPVEIDLLRPPTFDQLCKILLDARNAGRPYHIVHFDMHGGYGHITQSSSDPFQDTEGYLAFETEPAPGENVRADLVEASRLAQALHQSGVSTVVLNACRSSMVDDRAKNVYTSVAAALLHAGIPSVIAMNYVLYVSGAKLFVPAFYRRLFLDGTPAHAVRDGRSAMFHAPTDRIPCGFQDWLVPQLYQGVLEEGRLLPEPLNAEREYCWENLHLYNPAAGIELDQYGLIGRERQIQMLERQIYEPQAGILVYGLAGAGKTTLVRGFLRWLRDTGGFKTEKGSGPCPVVWFDFREKFSASDLFLYLSSELIERGTAQQESEKEHLLTEYLKRNKAFIVWDNFEAVRESMPEDEQARLRDFLNSLHGGRTKVIITSRTKEVWLGTACAQPVEVLPDLEGDKRLDFSDKANTKRLRAALKAVRSATDPNRKQILELLGLHEKFADAEFIEELLLSLLRIEPDSPEHLAFDQCVKSCFALLEQAGLCTPMGKNIFRIHPALQSLLAKDFSAPENVKRIFVSGICDMERCCHSDEARRRKFCKYHEANLANALELAKQLNMNIETLYLLSALAVSADDRGDYRHAESLWLKTVKEAEQHGNTEELRLAYSQLGILAQRRGDEDAARHWSQWATKLWGYNSQNTEALYRRGYDAFQKGDLVTAKDCFENTLFQSEVLGNQRLALASYGMLGAVAVKQGDTVDAERYFENLLFGADKLNDLALKAEARRSLASFEEDREDLSAAMHHYLEAYGIYHHLDNQHAEAVIRQTLGTLFNKAVQCSAAREQFQAALALFRQFDSEQVDLEIAECYEGLGVVCELEGDIAEAIYWYQKALEIHARHDHNEREDRVRKK